MPLGGLLPYPNAMPQGPGMPPQGPVPPPEMQAPPQVDAMKVIMAFMNNLSPDEQKGAVYGIGFHELMKKMDLGKTKRTGADGVAGPTAPQPGGGNMAAPLAPSNRPMGF